MIAVKILRPRMGLTPMSRRRVAVALGLALAAALKRVGRFEHTETRTWRGVPDVAYIIGEEVNVELNRHVDVDAVESVARELRRWDGVTVMLNGKLGAVELGIDIDIYAGGHVPVLTGILNKSTDILAEPRGHVGGDVIESFYELLDVEREGLKAVFEEFVAEVCNTELKVATYTEAKMRPLWRLVAGVYALRDYSFAPEDAMPIWYRPWNRQMAKYLYRLAPPGLRELAGLRGVRRAIENVAPELLTYLAKHYETELREDAVWLIPLSAESHRNAVAELRRMLTEAMREASGKRALRIIDKQGHLVWEEYIEALEEEMRQRFKTLS
jgi:hypothetical protein